MCKCLWLLVAIFCPPLAVLLDRGCDMHVCINLLLTCLIWIPGVIHAIYVIFFVDDGHHHHHHYHNERC
ncbi:hypothetical protein QR680_015806 [Steinernema hermaphroditum]|uniref:Plasma membrane proteolipid 3 n=1 Tax=Steinernema hermaphroditum TaxID=289476 RepID=A0AA39HA22_9BILA|nr:hypothetical protein QR680_015806 [Steinernema hermaphroditum]